MRIGLQRFDLFMRRTTFAERDPTRLVEHLERRLVQSDRVIQHSKRRGGIAMWPEGGSTLMRRESLLVELVASTQPRLLRKTSVARHALTQRSVEHPA